MDRELRELLTELLANRAPAGVPAESPAALAAAKREYQNDPNRTDRKHVQDRITEATHELRVRMGLER